MLHEGRKIPQKSSRAQITPSNVINRESPASKTSSFSTSFFVGSSSSSSSFHTPSYGPNTHIITAQNCTRI